MSDDIRVTATGDVRIRLRNGQEHVYKPWDAHRLAHDLLLAARLAVSKDSQLRARWAAERSGAGSTTK